MAQIDEFECLFNSASKPVFQFEPVTVKRVMIVLDDAAPLSPEYVPGVINFLSVLRHASSNVLETCSFPVWYVKTLRAV